MTYNLKKKLKISKDNPIRCNVCQRKCLIADAQVGFCLSRKNVNGKIKSLLYGQINTLQVDPMEKKPFYHFKPGNLVATIGTWGCNFRCKQCLNWSCSWGPEAVYRLRSTDYRKMPPKEIAEEIVKAGYFGIAFSYNEPVIWYEYARDIAREFKKLMVYGLRTTDYRPQSTVDGRQSTVDKNRFAVFVTNGSWTKETIDEITTAFDYTGDRRRGTPKKGSPCGFSWEKAPGRTRSNASDRTRRSPLINAANIDLKGFSEETYKRQGAFFGEIPAMAVYAQKKGIFLELTTLLIPTINDNPEELKKMTAWIVKNLGPDIPWHLSQYDPFLAPDKEFRKIPFTKVEELQKAAEIGQKAGLNHIYIWAPNDYFAHSDTICPKCKKTIIKRSGWQVGKINIIDQNKCQFCGYKLNVVP